MKKKSGRWRRSQRNFITSDDVNLWELKLPESHKEKNVWRRVQNHSSVSYCSIYIIQLYSSLERTDPKWRGNAHTHF